MKNYVKILGYVLVLVVMSACNKKESATVSNRNLVFQGSDTELQMMQEVNDRFRELYPEADVFEIRGGGSGAGIDAFISGNIPVANASRKLTESEQQKAQKNGVNPVEVIVAMDAVAVITNPVMSVDSLSIIQLRKIYNGTITRWSEVGGKDEAIHLYGRDDRSGTYRFIKDVVLGGNYSNKLQQLETTDDIIEAVKNDPQGIGYVGIGSLTEEDGTPNGDVWATYLFIEGERAYSPYERVAVHSGNYPLTRPLFQYYDGIPEAGLNQFLRFLLSVDGQKIVSENGYIPINDIHRQLNQFNGITY